MDHGIWAPGQQYVATFNFGARNLVPFEMAANETIRLETEWDFNNTNLPADWSVVAWAPDGELTLTHQGGWVSDDLPYIADNGQSNSDNSTDNTDNTEETDETDNTDNTDNNTDETDNTEEDDGTDEVEPVDPVEPVEPEEPDEPVGPSAAELEFIDFVEGYTPTWEGGGCGTGLKEDYYFDENYDYGYQISFMLTCPWTWLAANVKVAMTPEDWESAEFIYNRVDLASGAVTHDSMLTGCEPDIDQPQYTVCTFSLKYYDDPASVGVTENWQRRGGVRTSPNAYGMRWYYVEYEY